TKWLDTIYKSERWNIVEWNWVHCRQEHMEKSLVHVIMRNCWWDEIPPSTFSRQDTRFRLCAIAGWFGHLDFLRKLVDGEVDGWACFNGQTDLVKWLLKTNKANIHNHLELLCSTAITHSDIDLLRLVNSMTALDVIAVDQYFKIIVETGKTSVIGALITDGRVNPSIANEFSVAFLMAARSGHLDVVELMMDQLGFVWGLLSPALEAAAAGGHFEIVEYLKITPTACCGRVEAEKPFAF
ncbi:hypothetical protein HDU76_010975, partial [Blyttiomyces sp. JEL0837]